MKMTNRADLHQEVTKELLETYIKKNTDYGDSFNVALDITGPAGVVPRLLDKTLRINQLTSATALVEESLEDSALDLANYAIMYVMWLRQQADASGDGWKVYDDNGECYIEGISDPKNKPYPKNFGTMHRYTHQALGAAMLDGLRDGIEKKVPNAPSILDAFSKLYTETTGNISVPLYQKILGMPREDNIGEALVSKMDREFVDEKLKNASVSLDWLLENERSVSGLEKKLEKVTDSRDRGQRYIKELHVRLEELHVRLEGLQEANDKLLTSKANLEEKVKEYKHGFDTSSTLNSALHIQLASYKARSNLKDDELAKLKKRIKDLDQDGDGLVSHINDQNFKLRNEVKMLKERLDIVTGLKDDEIAGLKRYSDGQISDITAHNDNLCVEISSLKRENSELLQSKLMDNAMINLSLKSAARSNLGNFLGQNCKK